LEEQVFVLFLLYYHHLIDLILVTFRMAASRERKLAHRRKTLGVAKASVKLIEPISVDPRIEKIREKIKVPSKARSALIPGDGRSMDMDID
jgi:large subunit ribosomal protein L24e